MTAQAEELLRERISAQKLGYSEVWQTVTDTSRDLAQALAEGNLMEANRAATYIADITRWLASGGPK